MTRVVPRDLDATVAKLQLDGRSRKLYPTLRTHRELRKPADATRPDQKPLPRILESSCTAPHHHRFLHAPTSQALAPSLDNPCLPKDETWAPKAQTMKCLNPGAIAKSTIVFRPGGTMAVPIVVGL